FSLIFKICKKDIYTHFRTLKGELASQFNQYSDTAPTIISSQHRLASGSFRISLIGNKTCIPMSQKKDSSGGSGIESAYDIVALHGNSVISIGFEFLNMDFVGIRFQFLNEVIPGVSMTFRIGNPWSERNLVFDKYIGRI